MKTLSDEDMTHTILAEFHNRVILNPSRIDEQIPFVKYEDLLELPEGFDGELYCLCDAGEWDPEVYFYTSKKSIDPSIFT